MRRKPWWIKERHNPQLGTYFVAMGQMPIYEAVKHESPIYGDNIMLRFDTEANYRSALESMKKRGERVQCA